MKMYEAVYEFMMEHVNREGRNGREACGLLLEGRDGFVKPRFVANISDDPRRGFTMDPDGVRVLMREGGRPIVGMFHSHLSGDVNPSRGDRLSYVPDGYLYLVVGIDGGRQSWTSWYVSGGAWKAEPFVLVE